MSNSGGQFPAPVTPSDSNANAAEPAVLAQLQIWDSTGPAWQRARAASAGDGALAILAAAQYAYTGGAFGAADRIRTPNVFKQANATAAATATVWTPTAGKKFRLMGYVIEVTNNASLAAAGVEVLQWFDAAVGLALQHRLFVNNVAPTILGGWSTGVVNLGNGILSAGANNVLGLNIGTALATGTVNAIAWGTEE